MFAPFQSLGEQLSGAAIEGCSDGDRAKWVAAGQQHLAIKRGHLEQGPKAMLQTANSSRLKVSFNPATQRS
jgi:hypothetical protein